MNTVMEVPWENLNRYETQQQRYLQLCAGRESDCVIPFGGPVTTLRAGPRGECEIPADTVRIAYLAGDGKEHLEVMLGRDGLRSLGIGPWIHHVASVETLGEILAGMLEVSMRRAAVLVGSEVMLQVQRVAADAAMPEIPWSVFIAEGVPRLGRLQFKMSPDLMAGCEMHPMPRRGPERMCDLPLVWDVRLASISLARREWLDLASGDVLRVLLSPLPQAEVVGALLPHFDRSFMVAVNHVSHRRVKVLIDAGGWISLKFAETTSVEYMMEDNAANDAPTVPVNLTLPVATMSLHEIDNVKPGTLVDTGVRLQDVEVALWTAGRRFASGRLVMIGEYLGVEIVRTERGLL